MKTKVKALDSFVHGRTHLVAGDEAEFSKGEADELLKAGLVEIAGQQEEVAPPDASQQDAKMDDEPQNKMEAAPENKSTGKKTTAKKAD